MADRGRSSQGPSLVQKLAAEFFGTFWLVFGGCGSAIFAAKFAAEVTGPKGATGTANLGIGFVGVALAFGLTVMTMAYAVGHISGGHFNPAVTLGAATAGRTPWADVPAYIVTQLVAGLVAGATLFLIASQKAGFSAAGNMAANGYGAHSPGGYGLLGVLLAEVLLTFIFLLVILGATDGRAPAGFAPVAIGLALTLIHLISIPISNTSVNPARSLGVAPFNGDGALAQVWIFFVAPIVGAMVAGVVYKALLAAPVDANGAVEEPVPQSRRRRS